MPMQNQESLVKRKIYFGERRWVGAGGTRPSASGEIIRILVLLRPLKKKKIARVAKCSINPEKEVGRESKN